MSRLTHIFRSGRGLRFELWGVFRPKQMHAPAGAGGRPTLATSDVKDITVLQTSRPLHLGFLTVFQETNGFLGGYLVTNAWGRPVEFRLTTAVQPNRVQQILYGPTLSAFLHGELIGKTLIEKSTTPVDLIVTDRPAVLELRPHVSVPVVWVSRSDAISSESAGIDVSRESHRPALVVHSRYPADLELVRTSLGQIDETFDLLEPFGRIREAVAEARKQGVTARG